MAAACLEGPHLYYLASVLWLGNEAIRAVWNFPAKDVQVTEICTCVHGCACSAYISVFLEESLHPTQDFSVMALVTFSWVFTSSQ